MLAHEITHVTQHHMARIDRRPEELAADVARRRSRVAIAASRAGGVVGGQAASAAIASRAGAGDPEPAQFHARERVRGRSHRLPAPRRRRLRRQRDGDVHGPRCRTSSRFADGNAPSYLRTPPGHLRAHRRGAGARARQAVPAGPRFARFPPRARAAAKLPGRRRGSRSRISTTRSPSASTTTRSPRATASSRRCCATRNIARAQGRARHAREDRAAASDDRGDGRPRAAWNRATSTRAITRFETALARYPNKMQLVYDYPRGADQGRTAGARPRRSSRRELLRFPDRRAAASDRRAGVRRAGQAAEAAPAPGRVLRLAGQPARWLSRSSSWPPAPTTATSTRPRSSRRACEACGATWPNSSAINFGRSG